MTEGVIARAGSRVPFGREAVFFLAVGGAGYVTDVAGFNWLRGLPVLDGADPAGAKVFAVALAMAVTYVGNRMVTWRGLTSGNRRREVVLFALFNLVGLLFSVVALEVSTTSSA